MKLTTLWPEVVAQGSTPWRFVGFVALCAVTVATKYLSSTFGQEATMKGTKLKKMAQSAVSAVAETIWAIGTNVLAAVLPPT